MKFFACLLMVLCATVADAEWRMRADVSAKFALEYRQLDKKVQMSQRLGTRHELITNRMVSHDGWTEYKFAFTPSANGSVLLVFRGMPGREKNHPWLVVDDVSLTGAELNNPGFEDLDKHWKSKPINFTDKLVRTGRIAARVNYESRISTAFQVEAGREVVVSFFARQEEAELPRPDFKPGDNVVNDREADAYIRISGGRIEFRPTFENCGVYLNRTPEEHGKNLKLKLHFREAGAAEWRPVLDPLEIRQEHAWRGSLLMLKESTEYEVKAEISGDSATVLNGTFKTLNSQVPIAKTVELDPATFAGTLAITESGTSDGYIRYTMKPGVLKGAHKTAAVLDLRNVSHIILEGLNIDANGAQGGIILRKAAFIQVRNCEIYNFGRDGIQRRDLDGKIYDADGRVLYHDPGIEITDSRDILVERCFIHSPRFSSNTWFYDHPVGASALRIYRNEGVVLRHNDLVGNDKGRYIDVVHGPGNLYMHGGFKRDADIYGNLMIFSNDDAIELEGGEMNVRAYFNRFEGTYSGTSTGSCRLGPGYAFRNLYTRPGDEEGRYGASFKNGSGFPGYGTVVYLNNTVAHDEGRFSSTGFHREPPEESKPVLKAFFRNNIMRTSWKFYHRSFFFYNVDTDWNLLHALNPEALAEEKRALAAVNQERNSIFAEPKYVDAVNGDFRLAPDSPGYNRAYPLPNLSVRHAGAFQDDGINFLPHRPIPLASDRYEVFFVSEKVPLTQKFTVMVGGEKFHSAFKAHPNDDFFTVTPAAGVFRSGEKVEFTVSLHPEKMPHPKRYNGVVILRDADGYSLPVSVYADYRGDKARQAEAMRHAIAAPLQFDREFTVNVPADDVYYLFTDAKPSLTVKITCGQVKAQNVFFHGGMEFNPAWKSTSSLYAQPFHLKAGENRILLQTEAAQPPVGKLLVTRHPELFIW